MLLVDSLYINNGGGKNLLDLLIFELNKNHKDVIYLFDIRNKCQYDFLKKENVSFIKASLFNRHLYYIKNKSQITSVLAFGNIPPTLALKVPVYTYFHNMAFMSKPSSISMKLKSIVIRLLKKNTTKWFVQSDLVKLKLIQNWNIDIQNVIVLPFFKEIADNKYNNKIKQQDAIKFIYISDGHHYKNHKRLIDAFVKYNKKFVNSTLTLTIGDNYRTLKELILEVNKSGIKIIDKGLMQFDDVINELKISSMVVYPSLIESFGLGLIEASLLKLPICASNLPYVFEVVKPNIVFDPFSTDSIYNALLKSTNFLNENSELVCKNELTMLIKIITNDK